MSTVQVFIGRSVPFYNPPILLLPLFLFGVMMDMAEFRLSGLSYLIVVALFVSMAQAIVPDAPPYPMPSAIIVLHTPQTEIMYMYTVHIYVFDGAIFMLSTTSWCCCRLHLRRS